MTNMEMSADLWVAIIGQTIVLLAAIIGLALRTEKRITKMETKVEHLERLNEAVPAISRAVARLEGKLHYSISTQQNK